MMKNVLNGMKNWQHFNFASDDLSLISQKMCMWNTQNNTVESIELCIGKPHTASNYRISMGIVSIQH